MKPVVPSLALLLIAVLPLCMAAAADLSPAAQGPVAAVFPPWWNDLQTVSAAASAGAVVRVGAWPFIVIVSEGSRPQLHRAGAWLLLNPQAVGGCAPAVSALLQG